MKISITKEEYYAAWARAPLKGSMFRENDMGEGFTYNDIRYIHYTRDDSYAKILPKPKEDSDVKYYGLFLKEVSSPLRVVAISTDRTKLVAKYEKLTTNYSYRLYVSKKQKKENTQDFHYFLICPADDLFV